ncbi:GNAT family N-acetyltransferase [Niabella insulamsoli]|uniref:GNAT family N-acetyltransferase n=1 Tax=Niabella insulamsoli TaxID=3144874 RepID=UPI0031FBBBC9
MMNWIRKPFEKLALTELYDILQLRSEVFVVEQHCFYQDVDGKDVKGWHLMGYQEGVLVAYARLLPPGLSYAEQSIGRVVLKKEVRNGGLGKLLMQESISASHDVYGKKPIKIGAQFHLKKFYELLGFEACSKIYDDAGIDHIEMILD